MSSGILSFGFSSLGSWGLMDAGPGGNVLGVNFANDGTGVCRTDTGGCYVNTLANPVWQLLITLNSMPPGFAAIMAGYAAGGVNFGGTYAAAVAPSNSQIIYMFTVNGDVLVSTNQGLTFSTTGFSNIGAVGVNGASDSGWNNKIAIDPANPANAIVGTPSGGIFKTSNTGASFAHNATVANGSSSGLTQGGGNLIAYDRSTTSGGATLGVYCTAYGTGVYHSIDGGTTWTFLNSSGMPTLPKQLRVSIDGTVYVIANDGTNNVYKYSSGAWSTIAPISTSVLIQDLDTDPVNGSRFAVLSGGGSQGGALNESSDHGATWSEWTTSGSTGVIRVATDVPWLATCNHNNLNPSSITFNQGLTNTVAVGDGIGLWISNPVVYQSISSFNLSGNPTFAIAGSPSTSDFKTGSTVYYFSRANDANHGFAQVQSYTGGSLVLTGASNSGSGAHTDWTIRQCQTWTSQGAGINQLINNRVIVPTSGSPMCFSWDRCGLRMPSPSAFPANQFFVSPGGSIEITAGWSGDYSASLPTFVAGIFNFFQNTFDTSGFSTDGGQTWTPFGTNTPYTSSNTNGYMAVATQSSLVTTAQNIVWFPGGTGGSNQPYYSTDSGTTWHLCSFPVAVPTTGTTGWGALNFIGECSAAADRVLLNTFYAYNSSTAAIYKSVDSGATWTKQNSSTISTNGVPILRSVPKTGSTSTAGWLFGFAIVSGPTDSLVRSTDGGQTWSTVNSNFTLVAALGFGASVNGSTPACLVVGIFNGVRGVFLSTDSSYSTWKNVTKNFNSVDQIDDVDGDKITTGLWYIASNSSGIYRGINIS